jgi:hypothetical protein
MVAEHALNRKYEGIAWGCLFTLWGLVLLFDFLPVGIGLAGTGAILLGLNATRASHSLPTREATTTLGILALVWGGLVLAEAVMHLPTRIPVFATLLIVLGGIQLAHAARRVRWQNPGPAR